MRRITKKRCSVQQPPALTESPTQPGSLPSKDYGALLTALKKRIQDSRGATAGQLGGEPRTGSALLANGKDILDNQQRLGWGAKVIDRLSVDLQQAFPSTKGFSPRNLKYMRAFAKAWPDRAIVQQAAAQIPWFHHCVHLDQVREESVLQFYIQKTIEHGWSRAVLELQIESRLHERQGKAVTNFPAQSDLATQILKDPYNFDFLTLGEEAQERDLGEGLLRHLRDFLLEIAC